MTKLVIGIVGKIGSGKTTIADYLHEKHNFSKYQFSKILLDVLIRLQLKRSRENFQILGELLRKEWPNILADALEEDIKKDDSNLAVIDGIRYENEVEMLRKFENNILISIEVPAKLRYERCKIRGEKEEDKSSFEEFLKADERETEKRIEKISQDVDYKLENEGSKEELFQKVDEIMKKEGYGH